jgi:hypothetical protein
MELPQQRRLSMCDPSPSQQTQAALSLPTSDANSELIYPQEVIHHRAVNNRLATASTNLLRKKDVLEMEGELAMCSMRLSCTAVLSTLSSTASPPCRTRIMCSRDIQYMVCASGYRKADHNQCQLQAIFWVFFVQPQPRYGSTIREKLLFSSVSRFCGS